MKISAFYSNGDVYMNCECVSGFAFNYAVSRQESVNLPVICAYFANLRDNCAHFYRNECLLPHISAA